MSVENDIIYVDKGYRRKFIKRLLIVFSLLVLSGLWVILWVFPWFEGYLKSLNPRAALRVMKWVAAFIFLSVLPVGLYTLRLGRKILAAQRFPPPETKVLKETKIIRGEKAVARGRLVMVLSLILIFASLFAAFYIPYKIDKIAGSQCYSQKLPD